MTKDTPHFFIVGAQRSGSTYLYQVLDEHPEIEMAKPVKPEPKTFIGGQAKTFDLSKYIDAHFSETNAKLRGEKSTSYIDHEEALLRIKEAFPEAKILIILRDPIFRAISNYFFSLNNGLETRSLEEVFVQKSPAPLLNKEISVSPFDYIGRGDYLKYLDRLYKTFEHSQLKVLIFERLVNNLPVVQSLYEFLEVNSSYVPDNLKDRVNSSHKIYDIGQDVVDALKTEFLPKIEKLEARLDLKLDEWR